MSNHANLAEAISQFVTKFSSEFVSVAVVNSIISTPGNLPKDEK